VVGSHLSLALIISPTLAREFPYDNVVMARDGLKAMIHGNPYARRHPNYYKDIWNHALNTPVRNLKISLMSKGLMCIPAMLTTALNAIETAKPDIVRQAIALGFVDTERRINPKNIVYFALEFVEGIFMRRFIANILRICDVTSVIWIHDGIWVHPCPGQADVRVASETANRALAAAIIQATGHNPLQLVTVGIVDLNGQRDQTVSFLQECSGTIRPQANDAEQHPIQEVIHEFDFDGVECLLTAENHFFSPDTTHETAQKET
jgi:hypothetical protein